jgi:hypothetical protein
MMRQHDRVLSGSPNRLLDRASVAMESSCSVSLSSAHRASLSGSRFLRSSDMFIYRLDGGIDACQIALQLFLLRP